MKKKKKKSSGVSCGSQHAEFQPLSEEAGVHIRIAHKLRFILEDIGDQIVLSVSALLKTRKKTPKNRE